MFYKLLAQKIGKYTLDSICYEDENSAIFKASSRKTEEVAAVKLLTINNLSRLKGKDSVIRFFDFLGKIRDVHHPNITKVYGYGKFYSFLWIASEWLEGLSLKTLLQKNNYIDFSTALALILVCLQALDELYSNGLIHGNLKPGNIWLTNKINRTKLLDPGLGANIYDVNIEKSRQAIKVIKANFLIFMFI